MTEFYEVIVRRHYRQEAYHDVSGYETEIVYTGKPFQSWHDKSEEYNMAISMQGTILDGLKESNPYGYDEIETVNSSIKRLVRWSSIGD